MSSPIPNSASPRANGRPRAPRSTVPPTTAIPIREPRKNAEKTQPYSSLPPSSFGHDRQDGRDRQGLEGDEGDRQDEAAAQDAALRGPEAVVGGGLGAGLHPGRMAGGGEPCRTARPVASRPRPGRHAPRPARSRAAAAAASSASMPSATAEAIERQQRGPGDGQAT